MVVFNSIKLYGFDYFLEGEEVFFKDKFDSSWSKEKQSSFTKALNFAFFGNNIDDNKMKICLCGVFNNKNVLLTRCFEESKGDILLFSESNVVPIETDTKKIEKLLDESVYFDGSNNLNWLCKNSDNYYDEWVEFTKLSENKLKEAFNDRKAIFDLFQKLRCDSDDFYQESVSKNSIDESSSLDEISAFIKSIVPLYTKDLANNLKQFNSYKDKVDGLKTKIDAKEKYENYVKEYTSVKNLLNLKRKNYSSSKEQVESLTKQIEEHKKDIEELKTLEAEKPFYFKHDEGNKEIDSLNEEIKSIKEKVQDLVNQQKSLNTVAKNNETFLDKMPKDLDESYRSLEKQYDSLGEAIEKLNLIGQSLVAIDDQAEEAEYYEGKMYEAEEELDTLISNKADTSLVNAKREEVESYKKQMNEANSSRNDAQKICVEILKPYGAKDFNSVRSLYPNVLSKLTKEREEYRRQGSIIADQISKRELAKKGIELRNISIPRIENKLKEYNEQIITNQNKIEQIRQSMNEQLKGRKFISFRDICISCDDLKDKIDEFDRLFNNNKQEMEESSKEIVELTEKLKNLEDNKVEPVDEFGSATSSMKYQMNELNADLLLMKRKNDNYQNFIDDGEKIIELINKYNSKSQSDLNYKHIEDSFRKKKISFKGNK